MRPNGVASGWPTSEFVELISIRKRRASRHPESPGVAHFSALVLERTPRNRPPRRLDPAFQEAWPANEQLIRCRPPPRRGALEDCPSPLALLHLFSPPDLPVQQKQAAAEL